MVSSLVGGFMGSSKRNVRGDARGSGFLAIGAMISLFCLGQARAATYYVNNAAGNDAAAGTSVSTAWATIGKANATLRAGDTVYIRAGTYYQTIAPVNSGAAGNPITYRNYPGESPMIDGGSSLTACVLISGVNYITVDGIRCRGGYYYWMRIANANYNIVRNCTFWYVGGVDKIDYTSLENASYNQILDCSFDGGSPGVFAQQDNMTFVNYASHNLVQGCQFYYATHDNIMVYSNCDYNVFRNNLFWNKWHSGLNVYYMSPTPKYALVENNTFLDNGTEHWNNPFTYDANKTFLWHNALQWGPGIKSIARQNVFAGNGMGIGMGGWVTITDTKIYHNTFYNNGVHFGANTAATGCTGNVMVNNVGYEHQIDAEDGVHVYDYDIYYYTSAAPDSRNTWTKNSFSSHMSGVLTSRIWYGYSAPPYVGTVAQLQMWLPNDWFGNYQFDPKYVNPANRNFNLQATSPCIDAGAHLTLTTNAGSNSTTLTVGDAGYFFSGEGAPWYVPGTVGDTIYLEGTGSVQIASIDYSTNTITLASPRTWTGGKKVYHRAYSGNAPDIGAFEYQGTSLNYTLTISATNGTVTKTPDQTSYTAGQTVTLQATPNAGYTFSGWSGDLTGTTNPVTLTMNSNKSVTANFDGSVGGGTPSELAVASTTYPGFPAANVADSNPSTRWSSVFADPQWIYVDLGSVHKIDRIALRWEAAYGRSYQLQVSDDATTWSDVYSTTTGDGGVDDIPLTAPASGRYVRMLGTQRGTPYGYSLYEFEITAASATYTLNVNAANGTVTKTPDQTSYTSGQTVTLQATPNAGYTFSGWSGDLTGTTNPATLTMSSNKSVTANFSAVPATYTLAVSATNGTVTRTPNQTSYTSGQTVTLQATPNTGYMFSGWSGDLTGTTNPATLTMSANKSVTANFTAVPYSLTVSATNGTVIKTPDQTGYTAGQMVTLQATPNAGYTFSGWSGDLTGMTNPATLTMNSNKSVTATFTAVTYTLTVSAVNGTVAKTPDQASYTASQTVTLQATPSTGYTFSGWSGALTGTTNPATLTMDSNKSVTATFTTSQPATYYVDRGAGSDNNDGKSPATAWQSIAKVNSYTGFIPGDQILFHRGHLWREQLIVPASGTAENPIIIGAYDTGNRPVLKGSGWFTNWTSAGTNLWQVSLSTTPDQVFFNGVRGTLVPSPAAVTGPQQWACAAGVLYAYATSDPSGAGIEASILPATRTGGVIQIQDRSYVTVQDIQVSQSYSAGICITGSGQSLTVRNCEADASADSGIIATSPGVALADVTIEGCLIHHNNTAVQEGALGVATYHEGLTVEGVNGFAVRGCQIYSNYAQGVGLKHGATDGAFEDCQVNGNGLVNLYLDGASNTQIRYNKIYDGAADGGLQFGLETSAYNNDGIQVYCNLFWNNARGVSFTAFPDVTSQTRNVNILNNTFYNHPVTLQWESAATDHFSGANNIKNNLLWTQVVTNVGLRDETTGQQGLAQTAIVCNGFQQGAATDTIGTNAQVMADPYFADPAAYDFHRSSISSATIDTGTDVGLSRDFDGNPVPQGSAPDIGAYETAGSPAATYLLTVSATNGTVTKTPDQAGYTAGQAVTLQAVPNAGYTFTGWSGDLTGTTNPATLTMDANKSVTANFAAAAATYTLTVGATNGTVTRTPDQTNYTSGQTVTLQATPKAGYTFSGWSGALTGTTNPAPLTMNSDKSVTANFTAITYTLTVSAVYGTVTKTPSQNSYTPGQTVTLQAIPNTGYKFSGWSGALTGTTNPATLVMDGNKSVTATFRFVRNGKKPRSLAEPTVAGTDTAPAPHSAAAALNAGTLLVEEAAASAHDQQPPVLSGCSPAPASIQAAPDTLVVLSVGDEGQGVDAASVSIQVDGHLIYTGDAASYRTTYGVCTRSGTPARYTYAYQPQGLFGYSRQVLVAVAARDRAGNGMPEQTYSFDTEMYSFGANRTIAPDQGGLPQGKPATARDEQGNVWIVWHAGISGSRHIYAARLQPDGAPSGGTVQLSQGTGDHCQPALALDATGTLYAVWQENAGGVWDVCVSTSMDGQTWSAPKALVAATNVPVRPAVQRTHPAVAAGRQAGGLVAVAWQEGPEGNQDIGVASSTNRFETATVARVTSDPADQTDPALAVDGQDTIFVLWTDMRSGSADIYGAASHAGPWTNVPVVTGANSQAHPALAAGATGRTLHLAWVEDRNGNLDVFYAATEGLPTSPLAGARGSPTQDSALGAPCIIDDTSGADQQAPALAVAAAVGGTDRVFVCWEDTRNLAYSGAVDAYFAEVSPGALRTNVLVDDDGTSGSQREPVLGIDRCGYPYLVWVGDAGARGSPTQDSALGAPGPQLYYAGATYANPVALAESPIVSSAGGLVGTSPQEIATLEDVSVAIPALSCPVDATVRVARIQNPRWPGEGSGSPMAFGPGGLVFAPPVTITIPYRPVDGGDLRVYWFDAATGTFREDGIANLRSIPSGSGRAALQFETTHLGSFYLVSGTGLPNATRRVWGPIMP